MSNAVLIVTPSAAKRILELAAEEAQPGLMLRIAVSGGGCSGYQYGFTLDDAVNPDDKTFEADGAKVVIDETSLDLMGGAQIDFVDELVGASFTISNPNATASCGCGNSFAL
ncbi:MAG TPA: iron-sulfur cluster insertion protein ErpA [Alphaproteobacteria bacterium]|jgi:iron-sulfur cluster insertion protein